MQTPLGGHNRLTLLAIQWCVVVFLSTVMRIAQVVSKPNHIGSVSDSLGRLTAVTE